MGADAEKVGEGRGAAQPGGRCGGEAAHEAISFLMKRLDGALGASVTCHTSWHTARCSAPTPASSNVHAPPPCQLAEAVRGGLLAKRQIRARLQRGGAAEAEKVTPGLLTAACAALYACHHLRTQGAQDPL